MRVAVIGAGAAGLTSAKHVSNQGFQCEVFEMSSELGGTWVYTDDVDQDKDGYPIHTAMYKGLRTNLPKEIMGFPDFPIPEQDHSFLTQDEILHFLNLYADHFNLREKIRFNEMVTEVRPIENQWQITSIQKATKNKSVAVFDVVMVCNGHYNTPHWPNLRGKEKFKGRIVHAHQYRKPEHYKNQKVLVIGAGFSGLDIALQIAPVANVTVSYKKNQLQKSENINLKPEVLCIRNAQEIEFVDGSCSSFDSIIVCTGYKYNFPFLHSSCGVKVEDNQVLPLYKHMIHVEKPTMCFIGIPFYVCAFQMFDIQARFYCQYLNGCFTLPSKDLMLADTKRDIEKRKAQGFPKKLAHMLADNQHEYFAELAAGANITPIAPVVTNIWTECNDAFFIDINHFRNFRYRIINNDSFVKVSV